MNFELDNGLLFNFASGVFGLSLMANGFIQGHSETLTFFTAVAGLIVAIFSGYGLLSGNYREMKTEGRTGPYLMVLAALLMLTGVLIQIYSGA